MNSQKKPTDRLNYEGELGPIACNICEVYDIGTLSSFTIVNIGFEDCNIIIETSQGNYLAKMFASWRTPEDIERYVKTMQTVLEAGVNHPELVHTKNDGVTHADSGITMVLMVFIEGKSFYNSNKQLADVPSDRELDAVLEQASIVNRIEYRPSYSVNSWAVPNIHAMFERVKQFIASDEVPAVEAAIAGYDAIPVSELPHCFVHGDFVKPNLIRGIDGKTYVLDFSISNWYPRIHELAVIVANLIYDETAMFLLQEKSKLVSDKYSLLNPLNDDERKHLPAYALATVAMEFMGAHQEKCINGNSTKETEYLMGLGRRGLGIA